MKEKWEIPPLCFVRRRFKQEPTSPIIHGDYIPSEKSEAFAQN